MKFGFDSQHFRLNRIPAPSWALITRTMTPVLPDPVRQTLTDQLTVIDQVTAQYLQWAMTDPVATARFQENHMYADGVVGDYFVGRQHFDLEGSSPDRVIVETECCLTRLDHQSLPAVYQRFLVMLDWDLNTCTGALVLAHDTERDRQLSELTVSSVHSNALSDIPHQHDLSEEGRRFLNDRWADFLACVQLAAQEAIDDGSASGQFDDSFFPSRLTMTGRYRVSQVSSPTAGEINVDLRFSARPWITGRGEDEYLGYDLSVFYGDGGELRYELWGSRAI